jgi:molecular chaperone GrpE (heat shock protein)
VGDKVLPDDGAQPDLSTPELLAGDGEQAEELQLVADEEQLQPAQAVIELPDDPAAAVPVLIEALGESRQQAAEYLDTMQRVAAEFDNFRKRSVREREEIVDRASQRLIERLLPTLDSFDAALTYQPQTENRGEAARRHGRYPSAAHGDAGG